jgi:hypothetical protein
MHQPGEEQRRLFVEQDRERAESRERAERDERAERERERERETERERESREQRERSRGKSTCNHSRLKRLELRPPSLTADLP